MIDLNNFDFLVPMGSFPIQILACFDSAEFQMPNTAIHNKIQKEYVN